MYYQNKVSQISKHIEYLYLLQEYILPQKSLFLLRRFLSARRGKLMLQGNQGVDIISKAENGEKTFNM